MKLGVDGRFFFFWGGGHEPNEATKTSCCFYDVVQCCLVYSLRKMLVHWCHMAFPASAHGGGG